MCSEWQFKNASAQSIGLFLRMCGPDDSRIAALDDFFDASGTVGVAVARGFVQKKNSWFECDSDGDSNALSLAVRKITPPLIKYRLFETELKDDGWQVSSLTSLLRSEFLSGEVELGRSSFQTHA